MNGHGPMPQQSQQPGFRPPLVVIQQRKSSLRAFIIGCFAVLILVMLIPLAVAFGPYIVEQVKELLSYVSTPPKGTGIPEAHWNMWIWAVVAGLVVGAIIRLLRKI